MGSVRAWRVMLLTVGVAVAGLVPSSAALAAREVPVGLYDVNDAQGHDKLPAERMYAIRFVLDQPTTFIASSRVSTSRASTRTGVGRRRRARSGRDAWTSARERPVPESFNASYQAPPASLPRGWTVGTGRVGYAHGNGGSILARLVPMNVDGTPNLSSVIAEETFNPVNRYSEIKIDVRDHRQVGDAVRGFRRRLP